MDYAFKQIEEEEKREEQEVVDERLPSELSTLNSRHELAILLHLEGIPPKTIAEMTGYNHQYVNRVLKDPLAKALVRERFTEMDEEFKALYQPAIQAIRDGLNATGIETRLKAAEKYLKAHGKYGTVDESTETAEDIVKRIFEMKVTEVRSVKVKQGGG